jgi:DNA-binding NarL/FixJ family response regulator
MSFRLALADDHTIFRKTLSNYITHNWKELEVKIEAEDGRDLLEKMKRQKVDLVLTDIQMPELSGIEVTRLIMRDFQGVKVMGLSMFSQLYYIKKLVESGATGFVRKSADPDNMLECIKKVLAGEMGFCQKTTELLNKTTLNMADKAQTLSEKEIRILKLVFEEKSNEEIGQDLGLSTRREQMIVQELMDKLGVRSRVGLVKWMVENGVG